MELPRLSELGTTGLLIALPLVTAFVGWITNLVAVRMIFWPRRFVGVGPFGWQGIVYRHHRKFARAAGELVSGELFSARDISDRIDASEVESLYERAFALRARPILEACADAIRPGLWGSLLPPVRDAIAGQIERDGRREVRALFEDFRERAEEFIDLQGYTERAFTVDGGEGLARVVKPLARREFRFIEVYGAVFGGLIGLVEVVGWQLLGLWWVLPAVGAVVGLLTNWLAIQMIFLPREPLRFGLVSWQGLFPSRQAEIARDYADVVARDLVTARNLIGMLSEGEGGERLARVVVEAIESRFDARVAAYRSVLPFEVVDATLERIKRTLVEQVFEAAPELRPEFERFLEEKLDVAATIRERMAGLPKERFERILRRYFEEDEWTLILLGGALGGAIGLAQGIAMGVL